MAGDYVELDDETGDLAVGMILGVTARYMQTGVDYSRTDEVRAVWPEQLSADAMQIGCLVAVACIGLFGGDPAQLEMAAGNLMPTV